MRSQRPNRNHNLTTENDFMDYRDFDLLCKGLSAEELKQLQKMLNEWCKGDPNSFPVHLALLTKAQWHAAALIPRAIKDSGKLIEKHLAECRLQTAAIVKNLSTVAEDNAAELKGIVKAHTETVNQASVAARNRLWETEEAAKRIRGQLDSGYGEWRKAKDDFAAERQKLEKERKELATRSQLRDSVFVGVIFFGAIAFGVLLDYYFRH
jgi:hypothetical protein